MAKISFCVKRDYTTLFKKISLRILNKLSLEEYNLYHNSFSSNELDYYFNSDIEGNKPPVLLPEL